MIDRNTANNRRKANEGAERHIARLPRSLTQLPMAAASVGEGGANPGRHCWEIIQSPDNDLHGTCDECYAYFVQRDCWTLWALRDAGHKPCCQKEEDCAACPVLLQQVTPLANERVQVRAQMPLRQPPAPNGRNKQVCRYLEAPDLPVSPESDRYVSAISRAVQARSTAFRCRLRGVYLDMGYVGDMCVSRHINDCVFLEEAHPEMAIQGPATDQATPDSEDVHKLPNDADENDAEFDFSSAPPTVSKRPRHT